MRRRQTAAAALLSGALALLAPSTSRAGFDEGFGGEFGGPMGVG